MRREQSTVPPRPTVAQPLPSPHLAAATTPRFGGGHAAGALGQGEAFDHGGFDHGQDPFPTQDAFGGQEHARLQQLIEMGFSREQASGALEQTNFDVDAALANLLGSSRLSGGGGGRHSPPHAAAPPMEPPAPPAAPAADVQRLVEMGFTREQAAGALRAAEGDVQRAAASLLAKAIPAATTSAPLRSVPSAAP